MEITFKDKTVLLTGAAGGLGRACALAYAEAGARLALTDLPGEKLDQTVDLSREAGAAEVQAIPVDMADNAAVRDMIRQVHEAMGLDVMVCCAGIMQTIGLLDLTEAQWRNMIDINLNAVFSCVQEAGRIMTEGEGGSMLLFSSVAGRSGRPMAAHYASAKTALLSLTKSAAMALAPKVRVNAVCPGLFLTPMWDGIIKDRNERLGGDSGKEYMNQLKSVMALQRDGDPRELANAVLFLTSDAASYITGQALNVDGGLEMD